MDLIGIDIGGTKICAALGDRKGNVRTHQKVLTATLQEPEHGLDKILEMTRALIKEAQAPEAIGLAVPGPMSVKEGKILSPPNLPQWKDVAIVSFLQRELGLPVFINNDGNAGALAEWHFGQKSMRGILLYLTASTGMGGGIVIDGKTLQGVSDTAGEIGHFVLDPNGPPCFCGQQGCFEAYCGGHPFAHTVQDMLRKKGTMSALLDEVQGQIDQVDMRVILAAVRKKDPFALEVWQGFIERLAQGVGILMMSLNPDVIVLGTIARHAGALLLDPLKQLLPRFVWPAPLAACRIGVSQLGEQMDQLTGIAVAAHGLDGHF